MRTKLKKIIVLFSIFCILNTFAAGCGSDSASAAKTEANKVSTEKLSDTPSADDDLDTKNPQEGAGNTAKTQEGAADKKKTQEDATDTEKSQENAENTGKPQENTEGKWHVLDPEVAAAVDADFEGVVWHIAEGAFSIAETKTQILEDGSLACSSPGSNADIPDSELIHVVVDDDTYFYIRTIYGNGESYEDAEADFGDLKEHISVQMKGNFENDVFYASEVRIVKTS